MNGIAEPKTKEPGDTPGSFLQRSFMFVLQQPIHRPGYDQSRSYWTMTVRFISLFPPIFRPLWNPAPQVLGQIQHRYARAEQQRCLQAQRHLVMQQVFPPVGHDKFWQDHRQVAIAASLPVPARPVRHQASHASL